jgi:hypothetical protein
MTSLILPVFARPLLDKEWRSTLLDETNKSETYNMLPFMHIPPCLVIKMVSQSVFWLHAFPQTDGVSTHMSLWEIMTGQKLDYARHCKFELGEYVQTHEQHDNPMTPRTIGALALHPTGNAQGTWYFLSLPMGQRLKQNHSTKLPMPHEVIDCVHRMAHQQKANPGLVFADRNNVMDPMDNPNDSDDSDDEMYIDDDSDNDGDNWSDPDDDGDTDPSDDNRVDES